jgi:fructose-specific component phosphotransferase system IIB-like protein
METTAVHEALVENIGNIEVPEPSALTGVKVMVIDDSNTIRRSAEIFLLQAVARLFSPKTASTHCAKSPTISRYDLCRHHDAPA